MTPRPGTDRPDGTPRRPAGRLRRAAARFWLNYFFWHVRHLPWVARSTYRPYLWLAFRLSRKLRRSTLANARRLLGPDSTRGQQIRLA